MDENSQNKLYFSVKVGKSYKNKGWALSREATIDLIPLMSYEDECDIIVDGVPAKAHLNILPRIFYGKNETELIDHLYQLSNDGSKDRIELQLLLNKENDVDVFDSKDIINNLKYQLHESERLIIKFQRENAILSKDVEYYKNSNVESIKIRDLQIKIKKLEKENAELLNKLKSSPSNIDEDTIINLNDEIKFLKNENVELEVALAKLLKKIDENKKIHDFVKDLQVKLNNLEIE